MSGRHPIDRRLLAIARYVPVGSRVADIGSDHGLLPRLLVARGRAVRCVATEISRARSDALSLALERHPDPRLEIRHGDGLAPLETADRLDALVVAGVGAATIERILGDDGPERLGVRRVVLQPQTDPARVRRFLRGRRLGLVAEAAVEVRGRVRVVLVSEPGAPWPEPAIAGLLPEDLLWTGPWLARRPGPVVRRHWRRTLRRLDRILRQNPDAASRARRDRAARIANAFGDDRAR